MISNIRRRLERIEWFKGDIPHQPPPGEGLKIDPKHYLCPIPQVITLDIPWKLIGTDPMTREPSLTARVSSQCLRMS
jgi:hypothetical protein